MRDSIGEAIAREKQIKAGSRRKKIKLNESINPEWNELFEEQALVVNQFWAVIAYGISMITKVALSHVL